MEDVREGTGQGRAGQWSGPRNSGEDQFLRVEDTELLIETASQKRLKEK